MMLRRPQNFVFAALFLLSLAACHSEASSSATVPAEMGPMDQARAAIAPIASTPAVTRESAKRVIERALAATYPMGYDEANRCWRTERGEADEATSYCMRPLSEQVVQEDKTAWIYLALASASDIRDNPDYVYSQVDPGVMDTLKLRLAPDGKTEVVAQGLGLPFGSAGDCGCAFAEFVQVGPRTHGWMFTSGGTWQGRTVAAHSVLAPVAGVFKDVAAIPRFLEGDQSVENRLTIVPTTRGEWYALRLSHWRSGERVRETELVFDPVSGRYGAPGAP